MIVSFPDPLLVRIVDDEHNELLAPFRSIVQEEGQPEVVIEVPAEYVTDFASVPRIPLIYEKFGNIGKKPATIHDWLYSKSERPRNWCDAVFHHGLLAIGVDAVTAEEMYAGVRAGGESHYGTK